MDKTRTPSPYVDDAVCTIAATYEVGTARRWIIHKSFEKKIDPKESDSYNKDRNNTNNSCCDIFVIHLKRKIAVKVAPIVRIAITLITTAVSVIHEPKGT